MKGRTVRSSRATAVALSAGLRSLFVVVAGYIVAAYLATHDLHTPWFIVLLPAIGVLYALCGSIAIQRRPSNMSGPLMMLTGLSCPVAGLSYADVAPLAILGDVFVSLPYAAVVHLLLAFPSGRLATPGTRVVVTAGYLVAVPLQAPAVYLFSPRHSHNGVLAVADVPWLFLLCNRLQLVFALLIFAAAASILVRRAVRLRSPSQRTLSWLHWYSALMMPAMFTLMITRYVLAAGPRAAWEAAILMLIAGVPVVFLLTLVRGGFGRISELHELGAWLTGERSKRSELTAMLARVLGDPSLRLAYWVEDRATYVDADATPIEPGTADGRSTVEVTIDGRRIGAIEFDPDLVLDMGLATTAASAIAIALDHERLTAGLRASQRELRQSRARIVEAADRERRQIAQDLHDQMQSRLVLLSVAAQRIADRDESVRHEAIALRADIDAAASQMRTIVYGIMPPGLVEQGLAAATTDLADRLPVPVELNLAIGDGALPRTIEMTAYLVACEALTNATRHSGATAVAVSLTRTDGLLVIDVADNGRGGASAGVGLGLRGIADRIDAMSGRLRIDSPAGGGTRVRAELPCAW